MATSYELRGQLLAATQSSVLEKTQLSGLHFCWFQAVSPDVQDLHVPIQEGLRNQVLAVAVGGVLFAAHDGGALLPGNLQEARNALLIVWLLCYLLVIDQLKVIVAFTDGQLPASVERRVLRAASEVLPREGVFNAAPFQGRRQCVAVEVGAVLAVR